MHTRRDSACMYVRIWGHEKWHINSWHCWQLWATPGKMTLLQGSVVRHICDKQLSKCTNFSLNFGPFQFRYLQDVEDGRDPVRLWGQTEWRDWCLDPHLGVNFSPSHCPSNLSKTSAGTICFLRLSSCKISIAINFADDPYRCQWIACDADATVQALQN